MFSAVYPSPATVLPVLNELAAMQAQCNSKNYSFVPGRNQKREQLEIILKQQCMSVNGIACGNVDTLVASGFDLNKVPQRRPEPSIGRITKIKPGTTFGQLIISTSEFKNCDYCIGQVIDSQNKVYQAAGPPSKIVFSNIPVGEYIKLMVAGVNGRGQSEWTNPLDYFIAPVKSQRPPM